MQEVSALCRRDRDPRAAAGSSRPGRPRSCSRNRARSRSRTPSSGCWVPAKDSPHDERRRPDRFRAGAHRAWRARKEIVDIVRDRRTMLVTLVTAIVAGPVLMLLVLNLVARQADKVRELTLPVVGIEHAPALMRSSSASR